MPHRGVVESIAAVGVGGERREEEIEIGFIDAVSCQACAIVITDMVQESWLGFSCGAKDGEKHKHKGKLEGRHQA